MADSRCVPFEPSCAPPPPPFISDSLGVPGEGPPGNPPSFMAPLRSARLGFFMPGTAGADLGKPGGGGLDIPPMPPGNCKPPGKPPGKPLGEPLGEPDMDPDEFAGFRPGRGRPARSACNARAFAMRSMGRLLAAGGGRLALLRMPVTLELGFMPEFPPCGSDMVRRDGTRR